MNRRRTRRTVNVRSPLHSLTVAQLTNRAAMLVYANLAASGMPYRMDAYQTARLNAGVRAIVDRAINGPMGLGAIGRKGRLVTLCQRHDH